jgi:hypothetical protein
MATAVRNPVQYRNDGSHHRRENVFSKIVKVALAAILIGAVILTLTASLPITLILSPIGTYFLFTSNRLSSFNSSFLTSPWLVLSQNRNVYPRPFSPSRAPIGTGQFSPNRSQPSYERIRAPVGTGQFSPNRPQPSYERTRAPVGTGQRSPLSSQRKDPQRAAER